MLHPKFPPQKKKAHAAWYYAQKATLKLELESLKKLTHNFEIKYFQYHTTHTPPVR